ncbi:MEDS domain-containing protein [Streptomyces sp. NRRL S-1022]|uniref:MEDS domain-containing protein n=1 Tax=Streptomyces sp. NRRL S-1022 TaxID=1463880 RepID=UPI0007C4F58A|nr:MEDS domain-containing protein [Streptomyces sp. NRRL S-1022]
MRGPASPDGATAAYRHVAVEYSSDDEWAGHLVDFVRAGLMAGEQVQYLADATDPGLVTRTLTHRGVDAAAAVRRGQLVVVTADETYLAGSRFDPDAMIGVWCQAVDGAAAQGFRGLRAIGASGACARSARCPGEPGTWRVPNACWSTSCASTTRSSNGCR